MNFLTILRPYSLAYRNRVGRGHKARSHRLKDLLMAGITVFVMVMIYLGTRFLLRALEFDPLIKEVAPLKMVQLSTLIVFFFSIISMTIAYIGNTYTSERMNLLIAAPVQNWKLFAAKSIESLIETVLMLFIFFSPSILAFTVSLNLPFSFVLRVLLVLPFLFLTLIGPALVLSTGFMLIASFLWQRGQLLFLFLIASGIYTVGKILSVIHLTRESRSGDIFLAKNLHFFDNPHPLWSPTRWGSDILSAPLTVQNSPGWLLLGLLAGAALLSVSVGYLIFDSALLRCRSLAGSLEAEHLKSTGVRIPDLFQRTFRRLLQIIPLGQATKAIILKDLTSLVRDRAQSFQLLLYVGIGGVYLITFELLSSGREFGGDTQKTLIVLLRTLNVIGTGFVLTAMMTRLVYPSVSLEGRSYWVLQTAPVTERAFLAAKFWCWFPISTVLALLLIFLGVSALGWHTPSVLCMSVIGIAIALGTTGIAIGCGAIFAKFDWESPNQIVVGLGTLAVLFSILTLMLLLSLPTLFVIMLSATEIDQTVIIRIITSLLIILGTNGLLAFTALYFGARSLRFREVN